MKKFISLLLVVSILALSMPLKAKERKGADLIIRKTDGTQVRGELIAIKENSLLLMERESGADVTVDIGDIRVITIVKKSKFLKGAGIGALIGAGIPFGLAAIQRKNAGEWDWSVSLFISAILGGIGR